jgi:hypothetical protein
MMLLITSLSCTNLEVEEIERCAITLEGNYCRCHMYQISKEYTGIIGESVNHPLEYCDKMVGFRPDEYGKLSIWIHDVMEFMKSIANPQENYDILNP